ncbi:MAG TPA: hypothetical protein VIW01_05020 [Dehalococcoidia bacterium]
MVPEIALAATVHAADTVGALSFHELHGIIPLPWENHRLFGAGFLFVAVLLFVEALAGGVWFRKGWRRDIWPAVLMVLGWGLLAVAVIDPGDRVIHSLMGLMLIVAGVAERRYRYGEMSLARANIFVAAALIAGGLEVGVFHSHGAMTSQGFIVHSLLGFTAAMLAPARVWYAQQPTSMWRSAFVAVLVMILAMELLGLSHGDNIDIHGTETFSG